MATTTWDSKEFDAEIAWAACQRQIEAAHNEYAAMQLQCIPNTAILVAYEDMRRKVRAANDLYRRRCEYWPL